MIYEGLSVDIDNKGIHMSCFIEEIEVLRDGKLKLFNARLLPNIDTEKIIGVRIPSLRSLAKKLFKEVPHKISTFLEDVPHFYLEENLLHSFLLEQIEYEDELLRKVEDFLPFIDNWMVCDTLSPKIFKKKPKNLLPKIELWLTSTHTYTVRFAINLILKFFLTNELFESKYLERVANIKSEEYYINMMIAWFFAEALFKQKEATLPFIKEKRLSNWVHNKAIQKARESRRIDDEFKAELLKLKV